MARMNPIGTDLAVSGTSAPPYFGYEYVFWGSENPLDEVYDQQREALLIYDPL